MALIKLHPYYGKAGKCPITITVLPGQPCRVKVSDTRPDQNDPGQLVTSSITLQAQDAGSYAWIAAPMSDVTVLPVTAPPPPPPPLSGFVVREIGGLDSNLGTDAQPFASIYRALDAVKASPTKTIVIGKGIIKEPKAWNNMTSGVSLLADPRDPPHSMLIVNHVSHSGGIGLDNITLKGLHFDKDSGVEFDNCGFKVFGCKWEPGGGTNFQFYHHKAGSRIQGNEFSGLTWDPSHPSWGVYPLNGVWNDGKDYDDLTISDNKGRGGTFLYQLQRQGNGIMTRLHVDRNDLREWGSSLATVVGNEAISMVAGGDPRNEENTCMDNICIQSADRGSVWAVGVEATTAGCTYRNTIDAQGGYALGSQIGVVFDGDVFTLPNAAWAAYGNDGGYMPDGIDIRRYSVNGVAFVGPAGVNVQCNPRPSTTGNKVYAPSPVYVP
jgi:hypothetical protein